MENIKVFFISNKIKALIHALDIANKKSGTFFVSKNTLPGKLLPIKITVIIEDMIVVANLTPNIQFPL